MAAYVYLYGSVQPITSEEDTTMTKREWAKLDSYDRWQVIDRAAREFDRAANTYGSETVEELVTAVQAGTLSEQLDDRWLSPECEHGRGQCSHGFPPWFCTQLARSQAVRNLRQYERLCRAADGGLNADHDDAALRRGGMGGAVCAKPCGGIHRGRRM